MKMIPLQLSAMLFSAGIMFALSSCTTYLPQTASIPLMNEKNEVHVSGGLTMLGGIDGSVAYAPADHVALQAYASLHSDEIRYYQGAVGYFTKSKEDLNFEIYGGVGGGNGNNYESDNNGYVNGDYLLYFAQANFGQTNTSKAHIDYGFGLKAGMFDAKIINYSDPVPVYNTNNSLLIEPQAFMRLGGQKFKVGFQLNVSRIFNLTNDAPTLFYYPVNFGMSMNYRFAPSLRKVKKD